MRNSLKTLPPFFSASFQPISQKLDDLIYDGVKQKQKHIEIALQNCNNNKIHYSFCGLWDEVSFIGSFFLVVGCFFLDFLLFFSKIAKGSSQTDRYA